MSGLKGGSVPGSHPSPCSHQLQTEADHATGPDVRAWNGSPLATADASDFLILKVGLNKPKVNGGHGEGGTLTPTKGRVTKVALGQEREASWALPPIPGPHRGGEQESPRRGHRALGLPLDGPSCGGGTWPDISRCVSRGRTQS